MARVVQPAGYRQRLALGLPVSWKALEKCCWMSSCQPSLIRRQRAGIQGDRLDSDKF